jgi:hypothetical protein
MPAEIENLILKQLTALREATEDGFTSLREEQARTNENVAAMARTLVIVQRDVHRLRRDLETLKDRVTVLTVASAGDAGPPAHD